MMLFLVTKLLCLTPLAMSLETLQSQMSISSSTTTTTKPWPKLELGQFSASPHDPWTFVPHRKPSIGPSNREGTTSTTTKPHQRSQNHQPDLIASENIISMTDIEEKPKPVYHRHELPSAGRRMSFVEVYPKTSTPRMYQATQQKSSKRPQTRTTQRSGSPAEVLVSIPKIFADMAFTGHFGKITIPRNKIRYEKTWSEDMRLILSIPEIRGQYAG